MYFEISAIITFFFLLFLILFVLTIILSKIIKIEKDENDKFKRIELVLETKIKKK